MVSGVGFRVSGFEFRVSGFDFRVSSVPAVILVEAGEGVIELHGLVFWCQGLGSGVQC